MAEDKRHFYERRWLNVKHGRAFTIANIEDYGHSSVEVYLEIGDCSDTISLDFCFDADNPAEYRRQIKKLDKFIETCQKMRAGMEKARDVCKGRT